MVFAGVKCKVRYLRYWTDHHTVTFLPTPSKISPKICPKMMKLKIFFLSPIKRMAQVRGTL